MDVFDRMRSLRPVSSRIIGPRPNKVRGPAKKRVTQPFVHTPGVVAASNRVVYARPRVSGRPEPEALSASRRVWENNTGRTERAMKAFCRKAIRREQTAGELDYETAGETVGGEKGQSG